MMQSVQPVVLVVDDEARNIKLMQGILGSAGYEVRTASSGAMAIQMAQAAQPDLILLDLMMPVMDGYETCKQLKALESTKNIPVIFVTARNEMEIETRCFGLGAADYIAKPVNVPVVLARVKAQLALEAQRKSLENMFRDVMELAPDAMILSNPQGQIVRINLRTEQMFGYLREELVGMPVETLIPKRLRSTHICLRETYLRDHEYHPVVGSSLNCRRRDGSEFPGDINLRPINIQSGQLTLSVVRDVTERQRAALELDESRQRLRALVAQNEAVREGERKHMAREVHDELGQVLTALRMDMSLLQMRFGALNPDLSAKVLDMKVLVDRAIQGVRNVASTLRPAALDMGLVAALESLCAEFSRRAGIACAFSAQDDTITLDEARAVVVYRIVQESLTNISRYAHAREVQVTLGCSGGALGVEIRDNGRGFDLAVAQKAKSFGLLGMRERAIALGGHVDIVSVAGQGTVVGLSVPMESGMTRDTP